MKNHKSDNTTEERLYQSYYELIQFINNLHFSKKAAIFLIYLPNLTIITDLIVKIDDTDFWKNIGMIGFSEIMLTVGKNSQNFLIMLQVLIFILLLMPIGFCGYIIMKNLFIRNEENITPGYFLDIYQLSIISKIFQSFFKSYERIWFPIIISIGIKIVVRSDTLGSTGQIAAIFIIIFAFLISFLFEYYDLQILSPNAEEDIYAKPNFPNNLIDTVLLFLTIILANSTNNLGPSISCLTIYILRIFIAYFLKYQTGVYYQENLFILLCGASISLAILLGKVTNMKFLMFLSSLIAVSVLICIKNKFEKEQKQNVANDNYKKVSTMEEEESFEYFSSEKPSLTLDDLKFQIKKGKMTKVYRQLVFLSRRKNSHREQLIIDVMKSKCFKLEIKSRGGTKVANATSLLEYQSKILNILEKILIISNLAIELLKLLKHKDPKKQIFLLRSMELIEQIQKIKEEVEKSIILFRSAIEINCLVQIVFKQIFNDGLFLRKVHKERREQILSEAHQESQKKLFDKDVSLIIISVLDQVGKIKRVSKNLPNVLEYQANQLIGVSINELIPYSIRSIHDSILLDFVDTFTSFKANKNPSLTFYAINKSFHLQKVNVQYNFIMNDFDGFQLSGIVKKMKTEQYVILTDIDGNIEGWTKEAGQLFNLDQISGNDSHIFNFMPLVPTLIKYQSSVCLSTIFFCPNTMKNQKLIVHDPQNPDSSPEEFRKKQLSIFFEMLQSENFVECCIANIEQQIKQIRNGRKKLRVFTITDLKRVDKIEKVFSLINRKSEEKSETIMNKSIAQKNENLTDSIDQQYSINKNKIKENMVFDLNFSTEKNKENAFDLTQINILKDYNSRSSITLASNQNLGHEIQNKVEDSLNDLNENLAVDSIFNPKLERKNMHLWLIVLITIGFLIVLIFNEVQLGSLQEEIKLEIQNIRRSNRAQMIMAKSVFNPNITYTKEFKSGKLLVHSKWMVEKNLTFYDFNHNPVVQNWFYMFNVQIPSTLDRIIRQQNPTQLQKYIYELQENFPALVKAFDQRIQIEQSIWDEKNDSTRISLIIKLVIVGIGSSFYIGYIVFTYKRYSNQRKMNQAFFKFERHDLDDKISKIESVSKTLEQKTANWFVLQQFKDLKKKYENKGTNLQNQNLQSKSEQRKNCSYIEGIPNNSEISPNGSKKNANIQYDDIEESIRKKKVTLIVGFVIIFIVLQFLFLLIYGIIITEEVKVSREIPQAIQKAYKLSVLPNLQMADLFKPISSQILSTYEGQINELLENPNQLVPEIFNLLQEAPCENCPFMSEILKTNYRSFYSYFSQLIKEKKQTGSVEITEMYQAVDYITEKINNNLKIKQPRLTGLIILVYAISIIFFFVGLFIWSRLVKKEDDSIESFLKFFDSEILFKNKHMSSLISKNM